MALNGSTSFGAQNMRVTQTSNYDMTVAAGGRFLIDFTKKFAPAGNVATIARYSDARFAAVTMDSTMTSAVAAKMGSTSYETTVVSGADKQLYNGACPATVTGPAPAQDPYAADWAGNGALTRSQCVVVGSSQGATAGGLAGFWGSQGNAEVTKISSVPDTTHIVVSLNSPHDPGELVTFGAGLGWGYSSPRNDYPAGFLPNDASNQPMAQHSAYPIMRVNGSVVEIYTLSAGTQNLAELHLNQYQSNTGRGGPITFSPTISSGVVTALNATSSSYNGAGADMSTQNPNLPGVQGVLPPPALSMTTCSTTQPVVTWSVTSFYQLLPNLVSGGSGCPANFAITAQSTYSNPAVFYPTTKIYRTEDSSPCVENNEITPHCEISGFLMTNPVISAWAAGDTVEQVPSYNQYTNDDIILDESPDVANSTTLGPTTVQRTFYPQNGQAREYWVNGTPSSAYFGSSAYGYTRTGTTDPTHALDATMQPGPALQLGNTYSGAIAMDAPPMAGRGTLTGGQTIYVGCQATGADGSQQDAPCMHGVFPNYDAFFSNLSGVGGQDVHLTVTNSATCPMMINNRCIAFQ